MVLTTEKNLYILFNKSDSYEYKIGSYLNKTEPIYFIYKVDYNFKGKHQVEISMNKQVKYKPDTLSVSKIKSKDLKNYQWLKKSYLTYYHHFNGKYITTDSTGKVRRYNLNKRYNNIYVVRIDSAKCQAIVYKVSQGYAVE